MIKRCWLLVVVMAMTLLAVTVQAQKGTKSGKAATAKSAVKLGTGGVVKNSIIWGNEGSQRTGGTVTTSHIQGENGAVDPQFKNADGGDFRLLPTSPCIDKGTADGYFLPTAKDLWGNLRTIGGGIDIGAHEYTFYKVHFTKSSYVSILQSDVDGNTYDSTRIDPGNKYVFKLKINISGVNIWRVKKVSIVESGTELHAENGFYTISNINADVTVEIELDPPVTIAVDPTVNGVIQAKCQDQLVPMINSEGVLIYAFQISENSLIKLDTMPDNGYYCSAVTIREDGFSAPPTDAMAYAGDSTYKAVKNVIFGATFLPRAYPVTTSWTNGGGSVVVKNKTTSLPLFAAGSASPQNVRADYLTALEITATPAAGYVLESIKVKDQHGAEIDAHLGNSNPRQTTVEIGGISIVVTFTKNKYTVKWDNVSGGNLSVMNGVATLNNGDRIEEGTIITIAPQPATGFLLKSLQAVTDGGVVQTPVGPVDDKYTWTVLQNITLKPVFEQKKFSVVLKTNTPGIAGNTITSDPVLPPVPNNTVVYGSSLLINTTAATGYRCDGILVNGVKKTDAGSFKLQNIIVDETVEALFTRKPYQVEFNTPLHGTLSVEIQSEGVGDWNVAGVSGTPVYHFDNLKVTATPATGYKIKSLTLNGANVTSGVIRQVTADQLVWVEFEPETYAVHVRKVTSSPGVTPTPNKGIIVLKNQVTGEEIVRLEKADNSADKLNVPYGTVISVGVTCDESYNVTALDTVCAGTVAGSVLAKRFFIVTGEVTLNALIRQTSERYVVDWEVEKPAASSSDLSVYKLVPGDVAKGDDFASGTSLNVKTSAQPGDTCLFVQDQNHNPVTSPYSLTNDVTFKAKFVKKCTIRINPPANTDIIVRKDGVALADGTTVPAGSALSVEMKVKTQSQDSVRAMELTVDGNILWAFTGTVNTKPVVSDVKNYMIPADHAGGEIVFSGKSAVYYKVRFTPPVHGVLNVEEDLAALTGNWDYWYLKGILLYLKAKGETGYNYKGTYNILTSPREELPMIAGAGDIYSGTVIINKHLDIQTEFDLQNCLVSLAIKPSGVAGTVNVSDGVSNILATDGSTAQVPYGTNLTINATAAPGYLLGSIKGGTDLLGTTTGKVVRIVRDSAFTVTFGHQYQVVFDENQLTVKNGNITLSNGDYVVEGTDLVVTYTGVLGEGVECKKITAEWAVGSLLDLPADGRFEMPSADVTLSATTGLKEYTLTYSALPLAYGTMQVINVTRGNTPLVPGDKITHGDELRSVVNLTPDATGRTVTWYYVKDLNCTMNGSVVSLLNPAGANGLAYTGKSVIVKGNTNIQAGMERKMNKLYVKVEPENAGFAVEVNVGGVVTSFTANGNMNVPVGAEFAAKPVISAFSEEGYELSYFPDISQKLASYTRNMPDEMQEVSARFDLKKFNLLVHVSPAGSGAVLVKDDAGNAYIHNSEIVYGTNLVEIRTAEATSYYRLKGLRAMMKGVDQLAGQSSENYHIDKITDDVDIQAEFSRLYRVIIKPSVHGTMAVEYGGIGAAGSYYPAGTALNVRLSPDNGYKVSGLKVNGVALPGVPEEGGDFAYIVPEDMAVSDLSFEVSFSLKKAKVKFISSGGGTMAIDGLPGGHIEIKDKNIIRDVDYFTGLTLTATPASENYRIANFVIHLEDGSQIRVNGASTAIQVEGDMTIEVQFVKYYKVNYTHPDHGQLIVKENGVEVLPGALVAGGTMLEVGVVADEGYAVNALTWNGNEVLNGVVFLPAEADYDIVEIVGQLEIVMLSLTVEQPEGGTIVVEKWVQNRWETLDVSATLSLEYWTKIRAKVILDEPDQYIASKLTVISNLPVAELDELEEWTMKGNTRLQTQILPRIYTVTYRQPQYGKLEVTTDEGLVVESGTQVPYLTRLVVDAQPDDPAAYDLAQITVNGNEIENGEVWKVESDVVVVAEICINRWEITSSVEGEGHLRLVKAGDWELSSPSDSVEHYTRLKVVTEPAQGWLLMSLDLTGAAMSADRTFVVEGDAGITAVFKQQEEYKFPVMFTPNGDGYNDVWVVSGLWQSPENTLEIYNRLEQRVYKISPYMNNWEGTTDNGEILPPGSYIYKLTISTGQVFMGMVSIARD